MENLSLIGKLFIIIGFILVIVGFLLVFHKQIPIIGRLPGDILIQKKNFSFYFPITTSLVISIILSILIYLMNKR